MSSLGGNREIGLFNSFFKVFTVQLPTLSKYTLNYDFLSYQYGADC